MRILLMTNYFPPEVGAASHLYYELGVALARRGHEVTVLTGTPRYNITRRVAVDDSDERASIARLKVIRRQVPGFARASRLARGLEHVWVAKAFAGGRVGNQEAALVYSPPLTLAASARWHQVRRRIPFVLNVQDLFPQSAVDLGVLRNPALVRAFEALERRAYRWASAVTVHSSGNADHVRRRSGGRANVEVMPNWVNTDEIVPSARSNDFRKMIGVSDETVLVSFAGTLGYSQDLDIVIEAARRLHGHPIHFAIVGDGVEKDRLVRRVRDLALDNVSFLPMQPKERYPEVLAASDVCLATLKPAVRTPVVPSKILSIMSSGRPVLAAMDLSGDAPELIRESSTGFCVQAGDLDNFVASLKRLASDQALRARMGEKGRMYACTHLSVDAAAARYEDLFERVIDSHRRRALSVESGL